MKEMVFVSFIVVLAMPAFGQDQPNNIHQATTTPSGARYEILQSELAAKWTFRLDRFTGRISQLVRTKDDDNTWEDMEVINRPEIASPNHARFQLFSSGIASRYTLMIDNETGDTWQIISMKRTTRSGSQEEVSVWQPFPK
jgi:hypothetical protein